MTKERLIALILEALQGVKETETAYDDLELSEDTLVLGNDSPFDSIAFSAFAVALEEKIEDESGGEFVTDVAQLFQLNPGSTSLSVAQLAASIQEILTKEPQS